MTAAINPLQQSPTVSEPAVELVIHPVQETAQKIDEATMQCHVCLDGVSKEDAAGHELHLLHRSCFADCLNKHVKPWECIVCRAPWGPDVINKDNLYVPSPPPPRSENAVALNFSEDAEDPGDQVIPEERSSLDSFRDICAHRRCTNCMCAFFVLLFGSLIIAGIYNIVTNK